MTNEQKALILSAFKKRVCMKAKEVDPTEEYDWFSLSIGFFLSFDNITTEEAYDLATEVRYTHHYWID